MADLRFQVTIEDVSTKKSKDGPLTTILLRVDDAMPSHIGRLAGHVGKGATITVSPFQQELPLYEPDAPVQGELWTVAPARTVPAPEPSAEAIVAECEEIAAQADAEGQPTDQEAEEPLDVDTDIAAVQLPEGEDPEVTELAELFGRPLPSDSFADVPLETALLPRAPRRRAAR